MPEKTRNFSETNHGFLFILPAWFYPERRKEVPDVDQIKIGKFIASCRKAKSLTQASLAEKLGITDRAVSKWETGKSLPDSGIMLELCELLEINVNELLSGEKIMTESYDRTAEKNLLAMKREMEEQNRLMLKMEYLISFPVVAVGLILCAVAAYAEIPEWTRAVMIVSALAMILTVGLIAIGIEQKAGYYECGVCGCRYMPRYGQIFISPHMGRTRYMKCPECGKHSWQKKVLKSEKSEAEG